MGYRLSFSMGLAVAAAFLQTGSAIAGHEAGDLRAMPGAYRGSCATAVVEGAGGSRVESANSGGTLWLAGRVGEAYAIRMENNCRGRILAVVSVDGVNAVTGETAAAGQGGYVLEPGRTVRVEGWRKDMGSVAAFRFSYPGGSYASKTGRPENVGVLGVAFFMERERPPEVSIMSQNKARAGAANEASAPSAAPSQGMDSKADSLSGLGTSHGERIDSPVRRTEFRRASSHPFHTWTARYDTREALVRAGILPGMPGPGVPDPFPGGFVADPPR